MRLLIKIIIVIAIVVGSLYLGARYLNAPATENGLLDIKTAETPLTKDAVLQTNSLAIDFGNGQKSEFNDLTLADGESAFAQLQKITAENNIELKYKDYGGELGAMIEAIGGIAGGAEANKYWQYYVNGQLATVGASQYRLKAGDRIEWKYEEAKF